MGLLTRNKKHKSHKKKVLIADDDIQVRQLLSSILKKDYTVFTARDGKEAIDLALNEKPDLILMDILMPNMDGYTACSVIKSKAETRSTPLIMITGIAHELNRSFSEKIGADGYITKPFDCQALKDKINLLLGHVPSI